MSILEVIKQDTPEILTSSVARIIALTFTGGIFLNLIFIPLFWKTTESVILTGASDSSGQQIVIMNLGIYFLISFAYCFIASISFSPKRLVSPFHVQIIVIGGIILQIIVAFHQGKFPLETSIFISNSFGALSMYVLMFVMIGWMMEKGVKKLIGFSGTEKDLVEETFTINVTYQDVRIILKNRDFRKDHDFKLVRNDDDKIVLQTNSYADIRMIVVAIPKNEEETIISIVSHGLNYDSLIASRRARYKTRSLKRDILKDELSDLESNVKDEPYDEENEALENARKLTMKSTRTVLKDTPIRLFVTVIVLVGIGGWLTQPLFDNTITQDAYLAVWVSIITTIILLVVPTLRRRNQKE
ncbi:hypothetical protein [Nitrosopumilus sp.]|uniref:hypothetical protein n=1 Tax=Nitrosopumilus sp. TaxID=2024843 RepID=UPI0034A04659